MKEHWVMPWGCGIKRLLPVWSTFLACALFADGQSGSTPDVVDYALPGHWITLPASKAITKPVDLFYVPPTAWAKKNTSDPNICAIDNPEMMQHAQAAVMRDATAFETVANLFAPYYRQADAGYTFNLSLDEQDKFVGGVPAHDVSAAFEHYIDHHNHGRPFILAGHSQGSNVLLFLLADYMKKHPAVYRRMVAAYIIGYSVTPDYLAKNPHLKFAQGAADTGVIISYNTEASTIDGHNPVIRSGALVINPLSWTTAETPAATNLNLGGRIVENGREIQPYPLQGFAAARVDHRRHALICDSYDTLVDRLALDPHFPRGVYHLFDYMFYYYNLRANAEKRVSVFLGGKG